MASLDQNKTCEAEGEKAWVTKKWHLKGLQQFSV